MTDLFGFPIAAKDSNAQTPLSSENTPLQSSNVESRRWTFEDELRLLTPSAGENSKKDADQAQPFPGLGEGNKVDKPWPWTREEDALLVEYQKKWGNKWKKIAALLPHRTANAAKNRWNSVLKCTDGMSGEPGVLRYCATVPFGGFPLPMFGVRTYTNWWFAPPRPGN
jgi:hypothetical protein